MPKMRYGLIVLSMLLCAVTSAAAQVSIGIGRPNVSIGINLPLYPELVPVPGYPVYYAPRVDSNYFFYDGMYWVYDGDNWYASTWYNGPWALVDPEAVPLFVLRVPVRYYRRPPAYFVGWRADAPPLWGVHWGPAWEQRRRGWDRWDRRVVYTRAPLPVYQRRYAGDRYPTVDVQFTLRSQNYRYQPRDTVVRVHYQEQAARAPASAQQKKQASSAKESAPSQVKKKEGTQSAKESAPSQVKKKEGTQSAKESAPGQVKKKEGTQSAKESAPGQVKKKEGTQSAKEFAPGQVKKEQGAQSKPKPKAKDEDKGKGRGKDDERRDKK